MRKLKRRKNKAKNFKNNNKSKIWDKNFIGWNFIFNFKDIDI
jgi:hypothetical protein